MNRVQGGSKESEVKREMIIVNGGCRNKEQCGDEMRLEKM